MPATQQASPLVLLPVDDRRPPSPAKSPKAVYGRVQDVKKPIVQQSREAPSLRRELPVEVARSPTPPLPATTTTTTTTEKLEVAPQKEREKEEVEVEVKEEAGIVVDMDTFNQILELDEDDDDFSRGMVFDYFSQAGTTFDDIENALKAKDLAQISSLGHYFKGSSAALGLVKVQASCEKIQHYGHLRDEEVDRDLEEEEALVMIGRVLSQVQDEYSAAEKWLRDWYGGAEPQANGT